MLQLSFIFAWNGLLEIVFLFFRSLFPACPFGRAKFKNMLAACDSEFYILILYLIWRKPSRCFAHTVRSLPDNNVICKFF